MLLSLGPFSVASESGEGPLVVIKADDLVYCDDGTVFGSGWNRFLEIAEAKGIKTSIGIICNSLNDGAPVYFEKIRALHGSGQVEFWNHGYTHGKNKDTGASEFKGPDFETQLNTLSRSQALAVEKLGFPFASFGSPFNANDANTILALCETPEITSWMYGLKDAELLPGQIVITRWINMEQPVHHPNFEAFKKDFLIDPSRPYYLLQGHPGGWDTARFDEFEKIVDFLLEQGAVFLTPTELRDRLVSEK